MSFFTDAEVTELRELSALAMDIELVLRAPGAKTHDDATGRTTYPEGATRYTGEAAIRPVSPSRVPTVGERIQPYQRATIHLPHTAPQGFKDDLVEITACPRNAELVGAEFVVSGVAMDSDLVSWTLHVERVAGSRST